MQKIGIDVSSYQGVIDWYKVKKAGIDFSILKIIRKDLAPDKQFENNLTGCLTYGIPVQGVYNYTYATTPEKARTDAGKVLKILHGRRAKVYLDVEDECLERLGGKLTDVIDAYAEVINGAGLEFGVYTGEYFYNTYIRPHGGVKYPLWIARYGLNNGQINEKYFPRVGRDIEGWQYTSAGRVDGIKGDVDMNAWYGNIITDITDEKLAVNKTVDELAREVLDGIWGNGPDRKNRLEAAGYNYDTIQAKVNEICESQSKTEHVVKKGDTLSLIAKRYNTSVSALVQINKIANPNVIRIGQIIKIK